LLEKEYNQLFKIVGYSYSYDTHYSADNCSGDTCIVRKFGTYKLKIQAVNNPIIVMSLRLEDTEKGYKLLKYSIKNGYCAKFADIYEKKNDYPKEDMVKSKKVCDIRG